MDVMLRGSADSGYIAENGAVTNAGGECDVVKDKPVYRSIKRISDVFLYGFFLFAKPFMVLCFLLWLVYFMIYEVFCN